MLIFRRDVYVEKRQLRHGAPILSLIASGRPEPIVAHKPACFDSGHNKLALTLAVLTIHVNITALLYHRDAVAHFRTKAATRLAMRSRNNGGDRGISRDMNTMHRLAMNYSSEKYIFRRLAENRTILLRRAAISPKCDKGGCRRGVLVCLALARSRMTASTTVRLA